MVQKRRAVRKCRKTSETKAEFFRDEQPTPEPFQPGLSDDLGINVVAKPVHVHDLQATTLHLLCIDHTRLTYRFQGRDFRLTDIHGKVVKEILS